jgi:ribosomal protein L29
MKTEKLKSLTIKALETRLEKLTKELSDLRFDIRIGQEKDYSVLGRKRKEVARIKTLLHANKLGFYTPSAKEEVVEAKQDAKEDVKKKEVKVKKKVEKKKEDK